MSRFDEFDQYSEDLLLAQYDVSEIITHELMKGEIREDFLLDILKSCSEPEPTIVKGTLSDGTRDAGQLDLILLRAHAHPRKLGGQCFVQKDDALCVIEVKGNCSGDDLRKAEKKAQLIASLQGMSSPIYGVICYRAALQKKTILNRFGYKYDASTDTYYDNSTVPNELPSDWQKIDYPNINFFACLEDEKKLFLRSYSRSDGETRFLNSSQTPLIKDLFTLVGSLWRQSNLATMQGN